MREDTRPDGSDAVDRVTDSGARPASSGDVNHEWNWMNGSTDRSERRRCARENCAARDGVWVPEGVSPGATAWGREMSERLIVGKDGGKIALWAAEGSLGAVFHVLRGLF